MVEVHEPGCGFESPKGGHTMDQNEQFLSRKLQPKTMHIGQRITGLPMQSRSSTEASFYQTSGPRAPAVNGPPPCALLNPGESWTEKDNRCHFLYVIFEPNEM